MSVEQEATQLGSIAIIGMACRFPGAGSIEAFWNNLRGGVESISFFADQDLDRAAIDPAELADPRYVKARGVLEGIEEFDARFFDFSAREADITDPQQRIFLECAWEALEKAGYDPGAYPGPIGVYAGAGANGYLLHNLASAGQLSGTINAFQALIHNKNDHLATRVAYKLNLKGPAVTVQTACSTSLVAVIHACQSLLSHQCDMALAGGVTITVPQRTGYLYNDRGIGSPDGHCRAFDARAQGTVAGSGAGVVVLKRLADALADGDSIQAIILGGALNNDGSGKVGYTAPSVDGQAEVVSMAQAVAGVEPDSITYVEAHGTGTPLGDPIEIKALTQAFRRQTQRTGFCAIGSVKTNLGHLDTAAGVAGLMKTALALKHRQIPPSLHFESPNPEIDFSSTPFRVSARLAEWESPGVRRAGVSSFGLGGTNAHVVLEEAPARGASGPSRPYQLVTLSARSEAALEAMTTRLADHLRAHPELPLADVAYTLYTGRKRFEHRRIVVCRDTKEAAAALAALSPDRVFSRLQEPVHRPLFFMFPGQGSQYPGMAAGLYQSEAVFRREMDGCLERLQQRHGLQLRPLLFPAHPEDAELARQLDQTALTQPAIFAVEYALARLLMSWGLAPEAMIGHSVGEYVAACLAGVFSPEDALDLVAERGRLMQGLPPGAMLSIPLPEPEVARLLPSGVEIAAANGPASCVVAGPFDVVESLEKALAARDVVARRLRTSHAFHSAMMEPIVAPFRERVARAQRHPPRLRFVSNVTGTWITPQQATDPDYWARHLRQAVRFADGLDHLLEGPEAVLLEVGPGQALRTIARWHPRKKPGQFMLACLPPAGERGTDLEILLRTVGHLWLTGVEAPRLFEGEQRQRVELPTYPFERRRHWVDFRPSGRGGAARGTLEKRADLASWFYVPAWHESVVPPALPADPGQGRPGQGTPWLVLADREGLGAQLAERLRRTGETVIEASAGKAFRRTGPGTYELNPDRREDYGALLAELRADGHLPGRIAHLFSLAPRGAAPSEEIASRSFFSLLFLAQALGGQKLERPVHLCAVTGGMQEVVGEDLLSPEQATVLGPCRVIPREYPQLHCRSVDVLLPAAGSPQRERLVELLALELGSEPSEPVVAFRGGRRWVQSFEPLRLEAGLADAAPLRRGGVYLITGGLGGMGLAFAHQLASRFQAKLALVARTDLPPREDRARWLELHGEEDAVSRRLRALERLEQEGAEVLFCRADVADVEQLRGAVAQVRQRFGALHGVIHAAGVPGGGMVQSKTREAAEAVLAPKVRGLQALAAVLEGERLDFLVACSSLSSVVGRLGQVDYTAANAFMDAFVRSWQARTGTWAVAVNWGAWEEVGMAARPGTSAPPPEGKPSPHPLLQRCLVDTPTRLVFSTRFDIHTQWVVDEHRIVGNPAVPGVTYFEMVRAALAGRADGRGIELHDLFFLAPLRVPEDGFRTVQLELDKDQDGEGYRWVARSGVGEGRPTDHVMGRARFIPRTERTVDLEELRRRCNRAETASFEVEHEEDLGPRWRSVRNIHLGHNELLLALEMPAEFSGDFDQLKMHPALLDRASGMAKGSLGERGFYLPLGYGALRIHRDLPPRVYSHARYREQESPDRETMAFDLVLLDERGQVLLEAERLMQRRVKDPGAEIRAMAARAAAAAPAVNTERQEILPAEGVAALERVLGARVGPQVVVSVRDLQATLERTDEVVRERMLEAAGSLPAAGGRQPRPDLRTPYVAPRSELEEKIADAWRQVLGLDRVGVDDNFFDLGGDSVQAIQIIAKGEQLGLKLNAQQFFQYSTVAELAEVLGGMMTQRAEQGPITGLAPLTPDQQSFFERSGRTPPGQASRVVRLQARGRLDAAAARRVLGALRTHHDALRLRFSRGLMGWQQAGLPPGDEVPLAEVDLSGLPAAELPAATWAAEEKLRARLDLSEARLLAAAALWRGETEGSVLMLAGHELAVDATSWRLLVEDLAAAWGREGAALPPKTLPFKRWAERLAEESSSEAVRQEGPLWLDVPWERAARLPAERSGEGGPARLHAVSLPAEETAALREKVSTAYRADLPLALLTALARALAEAAPGGPVRLDVTSDGRECFDGMDLSRTVGCFDVTWPVLLEPGQGDLAEALKAVKERVRRVPRQGLGYGLLLQGQHPELAERLRQIPRAEVAFRHLGAGWEPGGDSPFASAEVGAPAAERLPSGLLLQVESLLAGGRLLVRLRYDGGALSEAAVGKLAEGVLRALRSLGEGGQDSRAALSPVDFPLAGLDDRQLGTLAALIDEADRSTE
jgi:non-ribosomal peptide synthase protein (TIGR01720 family)